MLSISSLKSLSNKDVAEQAIKHGLNFAMFRLPGEEQCCMYVSERLLASEEESGAKGFVIAPFRNDKRYIIPADYIRTWHTEGEMVGSKAEADCPPMPEWYGEGVSEIVRRHKKRGGKTVFACRRITDLCVQSVFDAFSKLVIAYPLAFVFCWKTAFDEEVWIGATPELLLESDGVGVRTMSLAGTRRRMPEDTPWDEKNMKEQAMVSDFIESVFHGFGVSCSRETPCILQAGEIEHICTRFSARPGNKVAVSSLLKVLAPTPAVSGFPRVEALADIDDLESFDRAYYSGYCGVQDSESVMRLFVTLRCMSLSPATGRCVLYAGGGITSQSVPEAEWREVNSKMNTLASVLQLSAESV